MSDIVLALLAAAPPAASEGWTNKEVLIALGSTVAVLLPIAWGVIEYIGRGYRKEIGSLKKELADQERRIAEIDELQDRLVRATQDRDAAQANATSLSIQLKDAQLKLTDRETDLGANEKRYREVVAALEANLTQAKEQASGADQEFAAIQNRIRKGLDKDSQTWNEKVLAGSLVKFLPLGADTRRTPIISVLNLKGGVGKTTVTANLAAALDALQFRALMVDLDLQGSLSNIFLEPREQVILDNLGRSLKDLLSAAFDSESPDVREYIRGVEGSHGLAIIPTSDDLAYLETDLAMRWRLREGTKDVRFLLRKQLQLRRVTNDYDFVLLDCPPFISVSCVNALSASDYLLIPVMPSAQATDRVPALLNRLREFINNINPELKVLGIVANRTFGATLTVDEDNRMTALLDQCNEVLGQHVKLFDTNIPQNKEVREAEDERRPLRPGDDLHGVFLALAREITARLPSYCAARRTAEGVAE